MKLFKKLGVALLAMIVLLGALPETASVLAAEINAPKTTVLQNDFIKITVDNKTGRFGIRTVEGQPIRKHDQNIDMLFRGDDPETSFTTFRIDGTDYIFGNPYKFGVNFFSEITPPKIVNNKNGTRQIETTWKIKGVSIKQVLMLYADAADKLHAGNVNVRYEVVNTSGAQVELGTRILLDTAVAGNDGPEFQIGTAYKAPLTVERKLVHDPENNPNISEEDRALYKLPPYWVMRDTLDMTNPLATNAIAYGFNNFAEANINIVDEMIVGHWSGLANTKWDYTPNGNLDFTRDTNDYGTADSAVAFYWQPKRLANKASQSFETVYGLGELIAPDKVFSIRFLNTPQQLATLEDNSAYAGEGIFDINAEVENLPMFNMEHSSIKLNMTLESGLEFVKVDEEGKIVRDGSGQAVTEQSRNKTLEIRKPASPEELELGIEPKFKPGDTITASFKVKAKGKPWPTTRQYMLTAGSPETQSKIEGIEDEGTKAQYESSKSNFILLPAVGQATATYIYGLSPKEAYSSDVKYLAVNVTNIEAYNTGSDATDPNFDLYLQEKITGKRYKVPVKQSVLLQASDDGFSGDMRITYRGGDLVDKAGNVVQANLGPELPLGEYQVAIDYKGNAGGDADLAAMLDVTCAQTFLVTDRQESRIREANLMAVYEQEVDLSNITLSIGQARLDTINSAFHGTRYKNGAELIDAMTSYKAAKTAIGIASRVVDPAFKLDDFLNDESLKKVQTYQYQLFGSEQELDEFFDQDAHPGREMLVKISGMIKQIGTGDDQQIVVDTKTEPAIINDSVAYKGKDMAFVRGKLDIFGLAQKVTGYSKLPFFDTLFVKGDGTLSVAGSGFVFHKGQWTLDFFNSFQKSLGTSYEVPDTAFEDEESNPEDDSLNGSLKWAIGALGDRFNPLRQVMIENVYFNRQTLFAAPTFAISGFSLSFNDFILRPGGVSFGGSLSMKVIDAEVRNVIFNKKGFVGIDASLKFDLNEAMGLFKPRKEKDEDEAENGGEIYITHYVQNVPGVSNRYGIKFGAELANFGIKAELAFKKVKDGRILPDVVAFGAELPQPGAMVYAATYLTAVRGALRELADTIAGGSETDPFPLVVQAGVGLRFGVAPAFFYGDIDMTVKRTGFKLLGTLGFSTKPDAKKDDLFPMVTKALLEAQWVSPWFIRAEAEVDIGGWHVIVGKAGLFIGQNLEKHRTDFEGYIGAKVQIPPGVPIVGGMPLSSVFFGANNDKIWGSIGILFISLGITYYWGGGVEFGTSGEGLPDGLIHMVVDDPEQGPRLLVIGQGVEPLATSWLESEKKTQEIVYRKLSDDVSVLEGGSLGVGIGGITVKNGGRVHEIPMGGVTGNAIVEVEFFEPDMPALTMKDASGKAYPIVFDNTNTNPAANAYTQFIPAVKPEGETGVKGYDNEQVDIRKAYILIPKQKLQGGKWTLTAEKAVETRLLNVPTVPVLQNVDLTPNAANANVFTAQWAVDNAKDGDTVSLYLTKDAVDADTTTLDNGQRVLDAGEPGLPIAKDLPVAMGGGKTGTVTNGQTTIDVTRVPMMGDVEDIRGLLQQGNYYLRAELKSQATYGTKTSTRMIEIVDPLAPASVGDMKIEPAGNGYFALSFKPAPKKAGMGSVEHSYRIEALREQNGKLTAYPNFGEILYTEEELAPYWNAANGKYEGIPVGGWAAMSASGEIDDSSLAGSAAAPENAQYTGLETGKEYVIGVSAATKPGKDLDKNENYHFAGRVDSARKLLPVPVKPKLALQSGAYGDYIEQLTNQTTQNVMLKSDQKDIEVEAFNDNNSVGKAVFANSGAGSQGTLSFDAFKTDGTYAIELVATNKKTKDRAVTMLYLTVDTIAPTLYIDAPVTGARTVNGKIAVSGTTSNDAVLKVNGTAIAVGQDGYFAGEVNVASNGPSAELTFIARDGAGNENKAVVSVTNDSFAAPAALVLRNMPKLKPGESRKIAAALRMADGLDTQGKPKFKEVAIPAADLQRLSFNVAAGEAVKLSSDGTVTGLGDGASAIQAKYEVSPGVSLESVMAVTVETPDPTRLGAVTASTSAVPKDETKTKIVVGADQVKAGQQLVYKLFAKGAGAAAPQLKQDISDWKYVPADGVIAAKSGDIIVVALRTSANKKAVAASGNLAAKIWSASDGSSGGGGNGGGGSGGGGGGGTGGGGGGGTGGGGGGTGGIEGEAGTGTDNAGSTPGTGTETGNAGGTPGTDGSVGGGTSGSSGQVNVNGRPVKSERVGQTLIATITADSIGTDAKDIVVAVQDKTNSDYTFRVEREARQAAAAQGRSVRIQAPQGSLVLTPDMLAGSNGSLEVRIRDNDAGVRGALNEMASSVGAKLLGEGRGMTIETNIPQADWHAYAPTRVSVPDGIALENITAVVLRSPDGSWTTVPWKPNAAENEVEVYLPGGGSLAFIGGGKSFDDMDAGFWGKASIDEAASRLLVMGKGDGKFEPNGRVTRAEYPTMLLRAAGMMNRSGAAEFSDVTEADWFGRSVSIAAQLGIVTGRPDGSYAPHTSLSRIEAMAMTGRLLSTLGLGGSMDEEEATRILNGFKDNELVPDWARKSVAICIKNGIIQGDGGAVNPLGELTRAQAAAIAVRLVHLITGN